MINATTAEPIVVRAQNASESQVVGPKAVAGVTYTLDVDLGFATDAVDKALVSIVIGNDSSPLAIPLGSNKLTAPGIEANEQGVEDTKFLGLNHDRNLPLARYGNSTLKLEQDDTGLLTRGDLAPTQAARDATGEV